MMQVGYCYKCVNGKFVEVIRTLGEVRVLAIDWSELNDYSAKTNRNCTAMVYDRITGRTMAVTVGYDIDPDALKTTQEKPMCFDDYNQTKAPVPPAEALAKLFKDDLGVEISPQMFRLFIRARWGRIAPLAHAIHDGK